MKARIPVKLKKEAMAEINRLADREYQKIKDKEINDLTRRIFKTIVFALHKDFGFGRDRCAKALRSMTEIVEHSDTDEVFWEHIDRVVIDKLKLEFDKRDYTDNGKVINYEESNKNETQTGNQYNHGIPKSACVYDLGLINSDECKIKHNCVERWNQPIEIEDGESE